MEAIAFVRGYTTEAVVRYAMGQPLFWAETVQPQEEKENPE